MDSSLLLKTAVLAAERTGKKVYAVTFDSRLHPSCDLEIAEKVAMELGGIHKVIKIDELDQEQIRNNPENRCYLCKYYLFSVLRKTAQSLGVGTILDGTNADDMRVYRPGIAALKELKIKSPLAELSMTKKEVKELAALYGISVASRPSTPCMATRLPYGAVLDYGILERLEQVEVCLREKFGGNVRARLHGDLLRLELDQEILSLCVENRLEIIAQMKKLGFSYVTLDLEGFCSGSMDLGIVKMDINNRKG